MNQLQVAAGSGEGLSFDFDIAAFSNNFKTKYSYSHLRN